jgi:hypothetical protein
VTRSIRRAGTSTPLLDALEAGTSPPLGRASLVYGYGVVFPTHTYKGALPPDADPRIVVDAGGLSELPRRIDKMFQSFGACRAPWTPGQVKAALGVLAPHLVLTRCVGADIALDEARLIRLTETQQAVLLGLLSSPRVLVEGVAGSGKTLLALEAAVAHALAGRRALFMCFNKQLALWAREQVAMEPASPTRRGASRWRCSTPSRFGPPARPGLPSATTRRRRASGRRSCR